MSEPLGCAACRPCRVRRLAIQIAEPQPTSSGPKHNRLCSACEGTGTAASKERTALGAPRAACTKTLARRGFADGATGTRGVGVACLQMCGTAVPPLLQPAGVGVGDEEARLKMEQLAAAKAQLEMLQQHHRCRP